MKRTPLGLRQLPRYSRAEEWSNFITHAIGVPMAVCILVLCILRSASAAAIAGSCIYGGAMILVYGMSALYHALRPGTGKKVMQVLDHCAIYLLIAGTYTPILLCSFMPVYPTIGWGLLAAQWGLGSLAITLTAIDLKKYRAFSMVCYILMGWGIIFFTPQALTAMGSGGFGLTLAGGIVYTVGAVLYGIGGKVRWMHTAFHLFVLAGSFLQFLAIYLHLL